MKFIIFISSRLRHGEYPKLPDFPYSQQHGRYIYMGKELTKDEFNTAAKAVFLNTYRSNGYFFCPEAITAPEPNETPAPSSFTLDGKSILLNGERIAGLFGDEKQLRVVSAHSDLRPQIEAWLQTITPEPSDQ